VTDEPTAWEDINPMASVPRQGLPATSSERLKPATNIDFRNELTACLTLVAPVGMTEEAKRDWLAVAWGTLQHLPADVLKSGCRVARQTCDHPSKIVPAILDATKDQMRLRREAASDDLPRLAAPEPNYCTPEEASQILRQYGLKRDEAA
jgi:hypothetical protein